LEWKSIDGIYEKLNEICASYTMIIDENLETVKKICDV